MEDETSACNQIEETGDTGEWARSKLVILVKKHGKGSDQTNTRPFENKVILGITDSIRFPYDPDKVYCFPDGACNNRYDAFATVRTSHKSATSQADGQEIRQRLGVIVCSSCEYSLRPATTMTGRYKQLQGTCRNAAFDDRYSCC